MANDWIFDVLTDLKNYAFSNGLVALADNLDETILIAAAEVAATEGRVPIMAGMNIDGVRSIHRNAPESTNA